MNSIETRAPSLNVSIRFDFNSFNSEKKETLFIVYFDYVKEIGSTQNDGCRAWRNIDARHKMAIDGRLTKMSLISFNSKSEETKTQWARKQSKPTVQWQWQLQTVWRDNSVVANHRLFMPMRNVHFCYVFNCWTTDTHSEQPMTAKRISNSFCIISFSLLLFLLRFAFRWSSKTETNDKTICACSRKEKHTSISAEEKENKTRRKKKCRTENENTRPTWVPHVCLILFCFFSRLFIRSSILFLSAHSPRNFLYFFICFFFRVAHSASTNFIYRFRIDRFSHGRVALLTSYVVAIFSSFAGRSFFAWWFFRCFDYAQMLSFRLHWQGQHKSADVVIKTFSSIVYFWMWKWRSASRENGYTHALLTLAKMSIFKTKSNDEKY